MVLSSALAALITLCAWIAVPVPPVGFTMQTFAVLLTLGLLGGKWGAVSVGLYLLLGIVGLPVFSGFRGGASALMGPTGGFLWGFLLSGLSYWAVEKLGRLPAMLTAQLICYLCGCWWFSRYAGSAGWWASILTCVAPYLLPDGVKLWLAYTMSRRIGKFVR